MVKTCRLAHLSVYVCWSVGWLVCLSVRKVYCGKMANQIRMPFGMVSAVGQGMRVLGRDLDCERGKGNFGVNLGHLIVKWGLCCIVAQKRHTLPK